MILLKKLGCSHAIYLLRSVTDYYINHESTVNLAFLDMTKAFDKVGMGVGEGKGRERREVEERRGKKRGGRRRPVFMPHAVV